MFSVSSNSCRCLYLSLFPYPPKVEILGVKYTGQQVENHLYIQNVRMLLAMFITYWNFAWLNSDLYSFSLGLSVFLNASILQKTGLWENLK